jgi:hypothetical protein
MLRLTMPIFVSGIGSAMEVSPVPFHYPIASPVSGISDSQKLASDWLRVGHSLYASMRSEDAEKLSEERQETAEAR